MIMFKFILFTLSISMYHCRTPDKVYCVNEQCSGELHLWCQSVFILKLSNRTYMFLVISEPISKAKTLLSYTSADPDLISFRGNADAYVFMKSAGSNPDLWYANINGKSGFVNSQFLREHKVIQKPIHVVVYPLELRNTQPDLQPNKVQQAHEVIEGTTIFTTESTVNAPSAESFTEPPASSVNENITPLLTESIQEPQVSDTVENVEESNLDNEVKENSPDVVSKEPQELNNVEQSIDASIESSTENLPENQVPEESNSETVAAPPQVPNDVSETPAPPPLAIISGGADSGSVSVEVPEKINNFQEDLVKPDSSNNIEPNTSNSADSAADSNQLPPETTVETNSVPDSNNLNVVNPDVPVISEPEKENSLFGSFFSQENTDNVNGASSTPAPIVEPEIPSTTEANSVNVVESAPPPAAQFQQEAPPSHAVIPPSFPDNSNIYTYPPIQAPPSVVTEPPNNIYSDTSSPPAFVPESNENTYSTQPPPVEEPITNDIYSTTSQPDISDEIGSPEQVDNIPPSQSSSEQTEETTTSTPDYSTMSTEDLIDEIFTASTESPAPVDENGEGILSNIYTTIADLWPTTTEAPLTENIFNPDLTEKKEVDEGFSFVNFILGGLMGPKSDSNAIFASGGKL